MARLPFVRRAPIAAFLGVMALVLAGCPAPDDETVEPPETDEWASCSNDEDGWEAEYPPDWQVNPGDGVAACSLFDPEAIDLPQGPTAIPLDIAVQLRVESVARELDDLLEDPFATEIDRSDTTVDGSTAHRIEQEQAEDGIVPEGTRSVRYVVDLGDDRAFIAVSYDMGEPAFDEKVAVLDEMMDRIEFMDPEPVEGAWRTLPDAPIERINHTATWTGDGMIVWAGGEEIQADGAAWDPDAEEWRAIPEAPIDARWNHHAVWTGEELLVWGGSAGPDHLAECFADGARYDPVTGEWTEMAPAPGEGRCGSVAVWTGDELLVYGGHGAAGPPSLEDLHDDVIAYDPAADEWRSSGPAPVDARLGAVGAWTGDELVVVGGSDGELDARADGAAYDPDADEWRRIPDMPIPPRSGLEGAWAGDELIVFAGTELHDEGQEERLDGAAYDPDADEWRTIADLPGPHSTPAVAWSGSLLYVVGGDLQDPERHPAVVAYEPDADSWEVLPNAPGTPRQHHTAVWAGGELIVWGGSTHDGEAGPAVAWRGG